MRGVRALGQREQTARRFDAKPLWLRRAEGLPGRQSITSAERKVADLVRKHGEATKTDLVSLTEYSRTKVSACIESLLDKGILVANQSTEYSGGRRARSYRLNEALGLVAGVQVGATGLEIGVADFSGRILVQHEEPAAVRDGPIISLSRTCALVDGLLKENELDGIPLVGIGIGVPGPVDFAVGTVVSPPIMPGWDRFPIIDTVQQWFPAVSVVVDNDVNVMALGEATLGVAKGVHNLIFVKIGTGIGAGIVCEGRIYRGSSGCAGDIGHICVDKNGPVCPCGNRGCLEKIAAGPAIAERSLAAARAGESPRLLEAYDKNGGTLRSEDVGEAAREGDAVALRVIRESGERIGEVLAALVNFYNPDMIVIGGGVSNLGDLLLSSIRQTILGRSLPLATRNLQIVFSSIGGQAGILGGISLALDYAFNAEPPGTAPGRRTERVKAVL
jgi:glucokinase-like ROK family protein